jgi:hypothetical protein
LAALYKESNQISYNCILIKGYSNENGKRPRTCLITDTPDHKQKSTIITIKQEKLIKRLSAQLFNETNNLRIPDTPEKLSNKKGKSIECDI